MRDKSRLTAFLIHLLISVVVLLILLALITTFWYPNDLIYVGGLHGLKILIFVDLVLGPILTLVVFSPQKKGLKFDLTVIACAQIFFMIYGVSLIASQRPMIQILFNDGIHTLTAADIDAYHIKISEIPGNVPKKVMMKLPESHLSWSTVIFTSEFADNKPYKTREELYIPLESVKKEQYLKRISDIYLVITDQELSELSELESDDCTWVPIVSTHIADQNYACISQEKGIEKLSEKQFF